MESEQVALLADIGGTNSRFSLVKINKESKEPDPIFEKKIPTKSKTHFDDIVSDILASISEKGLAKPENVFIALPGPVMNKNQSGEISNCGWTDNKVSSSHLEEKFGFKKVILLNDFEAVGLAICIIKDDQVIQVTGEKPKVSPKFIIGPGTGLGYCMIVPSAKEGDGGRHLVWPGEGGHQIFSPSNEIELEFLNFMKSNNLL